MKQKLIRFAPWLACFSVMAFVTVLVTVAPAHAQVNPNDLQIGPIGLFKGGIFAALASILNFVLLIGALIAFFFVLYGGFVYLTAGGDSAKAGTGRQIIVNAIIGILLIFLSLALVRYVVKRTQLEQNTFGIGTD